jgi:hypothetical protein
MQTFDPDYINEQQLDELLRKAFLNESSEDAHTSKLTDMTASAIFQSEHFVLPVSPAETRFLKKFTDAQDKRSWWKHPGFLSTLLIVILSLGTWMFYRSEPVHHKQALAPVVQPEQKATPQNAVSPNEVKVLAPSPASVQHHPLPAGTDSARREGITPPEGLTSIPGATTDDPADWSMHPLPEPEEGDIPLLTAREMEQNAKRKDQMMRDAIWRTKLTYVLVPAGSFRYKGRTISIPSFYMRRGEVTNKEYKTFLIDLLVQGRKEEYLKARPDDSQWGKIGIASYVRSYSYDKKFDNHPVVNISVAGAELYCRWMSEEVQRLGKSKGLPEYLTDEEANKVRLRIPGELEWAYAGKSGNDTGIYANGMRVLENLKGCELCNYKVVTLGDKPRQVMNKKLTKPDEKRSRYIAPDSTVITPSRFKFCGEVDSTLYYTVPIWSLNPNNFGLYCMAGNVAEWVYTDVSNLPRTMGGSWNSTKCHLVLEAPEEFPGVTGPSPFIGFRPVMSVPVKH